jgi:L-aminopeptidase/D-esterase-like protein
MADDKKPSNYDEVMDAKMLEKKDAAYNAADSTPPNPKSTAGAGQGMRGVKKMASGGSASSRADGCAQRGKTKGMVVGMNMGGMSC